MRRTIVRAEACGIRCTTRLPSRDHARPRTARLGATRNRPTSGHSTPAITLGDRVNCYPHEATILARAMARQAPQLPVLRKRASQPRRRTGATGLDSQERPLATNARRCSVAASPVTIKLGASTPSAAHSAAHSCCPVRHSAPSAIRWPAQAGPAGNPGLRHNPANAALAAAPGAPRLRR